MTSAAWRPRLVVLACVVDALNFCIFATVGVLMFRIAAAGFPSAGEPSQFSAGMLFGGIGLLASVAAAVCGVHGYWCWSRLRLDARDTGWSQAVFVLFVPAVATVMTAWLLRRLLG